LAYDDREAARIALERRGIAVDAERVLRVATLKAERFEALIPSVPFFPGARELITSLAKTYQLAIASGALRREIETILRTAQLLEAFGVIVGADDVRNTKPHPEPYLEAMRRLDASLTPDECVVIEDSVAGVMAGLAAGMKVAAIAHSYPAAKLHAAHRVFPALADIDPRALAAIC
ncbi:MAG: HAD family phosphatase, partial [Vicinamibacteria bacterium]|nr:HAD family phosphatase [Vicinamibacteria bacterium]